MGVQRRACVRRKTEGEIGVREMERGLQVVGCSAGPGIEGSHGDKLKSWGDVEGLWWKDFEERGIHC